MHGVARKSADLIRMSLVTTAAMLLAICVLALVETTNTAKATPLPENGKIAFHSRDGNIYTVEPDGSNVRLLFRGSSYAKWSPDGTEIVVSGVDVRIMRADGSHVRGSTDARGFPITGSGSTWWTDGSSVAFSNAHLYIRGGESQDEDIFMVDQDNLDNAKPTTLRRTPMVSERFVDFSPNGSQICFSNTDPDVPGGKPLGIYVMDVHGSGRPLLLEENTLGTCDWSPDGKKIVFDTGGEVYVINADGSGRTALTSNSATDANPAWSPDGTKIVFSSDRDGGDFDLYTMDADGSDIAQVANAREGIDDSDWQPLTPESRSLTVHPANTGGPSLLLVASALLFSGGTLLYAGLRRSM